MSFFDIQVNGYGGVDFNQDDLGAEDLHRACAQLREDGVEGILATFVTEAPEKMLSRVRRLVAQRAADPLAREMIAGLHVEGPFLSGKDGFRGAHPADAVCDADKNLAARLLEAGDGLVRIVTLAPERDRTGEVIRYLRNEGVVVSAGHTDASLAELKAAIDSGLGMITHLGNGCPLALHRHDNIVQRALALREHLWLGFIADGIHIPDFALRNYLALAGDRALVTTDAMAAAGLGPGMHRLGRWTVQVKEDLAAWAPDGSHLLGSAVSMKRVAKKLRDELDLDERDVRSLTRDNPRRSIGLAV